MKLSDYDLKQMDDAWVEGLPADRLRLALRQTLNELKEARDRLNMTPKKQFSSAWQHGAMGQVESRAGAAGR